MAEKTEDSSKMPFYIGLICVFMISLLLLYTEVITDQSVILQRLLLISLSIVIIPFAATKIFSKSVATLVSVAVLILTVFICFLLFLGRNRVFKIYLTDSELDQKLTEKLEKIMKRSATVVFAGEKPENIPEKLQEYQDMDDNVLFVLGQRLGDNNQAMGRSSLVFTNDNLRSVRFSGLQKRLILYVGGNILNDKNYEEYGFKEWASDN